RCPRRRCPQQHAAQRQVETAEGGAHLACATRIEDVQAVQPHGQQRVHQTEKASDDDDACCNVGELPAAGTASRPGPGLRACGGGPRLADTTRPCGLVLYRLGRAVAHGETMVPPASARPNTRLSRWTASS